MSVVGLLVIKPMSQMGHSRSCQDVRFWRQAGVRKLLTSVRCQCQTYTLMATARRRLRGARTFGRTWLRPVTKRTLNV